MRSGCEEMTAEAKRALAGILTVDMNADRGVSPLQTCLERAAQSLAQSFEDGKTPSLTFPGTAGCVDSPFRRNFVTGFVQMLSGYRLMWMMVTVRPPGPHEAGAEGRQQVQKVPAGPGFRHVPAFRVPALLRGQRADSGLYSKSSNPRCRPPATSRSSTSRTSSTRTS